MRTLLMIAAMFLPLMARAQSPLPNRVMTPGAVNPAVTAQTIDNTICVRGWTRTVRPPAHYTEPLKKAQIRSYGYEDRRPWHYEEDHLIPLDIGGSPTSPLNLWPEPHLGPEQWGSYAKDRLEARMVRLVCRHEISLHRAQSMMAENWIAAYQRFIGPALDNSRPRRWRDTWTQGR
ncbi:MAG: hypothetical protein PHT60_13425 [Acidiphilium sp.]|nr:hypothetical protein [Acidiphilium sp.]MDD4936763.1 hypothetical protein [Acidiphilium sp.]